MEPRDEDEHEHSHHINFIVHHIMEQLVFKGVRTRTNRNRASGFNVTTRSLVNDQRTPLSFSGHRIPHIRKHTQKSHYDTRIRMIKLNKTKYWRD